MPSSRKAPRKPSPSVKPVRKAPVPAQAATRAVPKKGAPKAVAKKGSAKPPLMPRPKSGVAKPAIALPVSEPAPARGAVRAHLLSLSFLRDGDEFLARLETDSGQITELKNRFLDQLLSLVANELEDLLE
jgi:hypothetical protein